MSAKNSRLWIGPGFALTSMDLGSMSCLSRTPRWSKSSPTIRSVDALANLYIL